MATVTATVKDAEGNQSQASAQFAVSTPTQPSTLLGAWVDKALGETSFGQAIARYNHTVAATIQVSRCYDIGDWIIGLKNSMIQQGLGTMPLIGSFEANSTHTFADILNNKYDLDIKGLLTWISALRGGHDIWLATHHEFDSKINKKQYTFEEVAPVMLHIDGLIHDHDDPGIISTSIMTGSEYATRMGLYWPTLAAGHFGARGVDMYQGMTGGDHAGVDTETIADLIGPIYKVSQAIGDGAQFLVCELGNGLSSKSVPDTPAQVAAFINSIPWLYGKAAAVCWFNKGLNDITTVPEAANAMGALLRDLEAL